MLVTTNFIAVADSFLLDLALGCVTFGFRRNPDVAEEERGGAEVGPVVVIDYQ